MEYREIQSHKEGTKAHLKEAKRCWGEWDDIILRFKNKEEYDTDFSRLVEIAGSMYGTPMQHITLGRMYLLGVGTNPNRIEAESWFQRAKKHGNDLACLRLSHIYAEMEDAEESISCLRRAKWHGSKLAKRMLDHMEKHPFEPELPQA